MGLLLLLENELIIILNWSVFDFLDVYDSYNSLNMSNSEECKEVLRTKNLRTADIG